MLTTNILLILIQALKAKAPFIPQAIYDKANAWQNQNPPYPSIHRHHHLGTAPTATPASNRPPADGLPNGDAKANNEQILFPGSILLAQQRPDQHRGSGLERMQPDNQLCGGERDPRLLHGVGAEDEPGFEPQRAKGSDVLCAGSWSDGKSFVLRRGGGGGARVMCTDLSNLVYESMGC